MSYTSGTAVALSNGRFVSLTVVEGSTSSITYQLYDSRMQQIASGVIDTGQVVTADTLSYGSRLSGVEVVADQNGGFVVAYNTETLNGLFFSDRHMEVKAYDADAALRLATQVNGSSVGTGAEPLVALADNSIAFVAGTTIRILDPDGWYRTALDFNVAPYNLATFPGGITASWINGDGQQSQVVVNQDGTLIARGGVLAVTAGTAGADTLVGGSGADSILGGAGDDVLYGVGGYDALDGGAGADKFIVATDGTVDRLVDFNVREGDSLLMLDSQGNVSSGTNGLLVWRQTTDVLTWDSDGAAGPRDAVAVAFLEGPHQLFARSSFAAGFTPGMVRTVSVGGEVTDQVFDWGSQAFDRITTVYTAASEVKSYEVYYDDGSHSLRTNDVTNAATWSSVVAEYDGQGRITAYTVVHDDASRTLWLYDPANTKSYERVLEEYDALGRLSQQSAKLDDGTAWERHIDTYDLKPWAYYIQNFTATGATLNLTYYDANGGVMNI